MLCKMHFSFLKMITRNLIFTTNKCKIAYDRYRYLSGVCLQLANEPNGLFPIDDMFENNLRQTEA